MNLLFIMNSPKSCLSHSIHLSHVFLILHVSLGRYFNHLLMSHVINYQVLKTKDYIHVEQSSPYDTINILPRVELTKVDF